METSFSELRTKEVINTADGRRLGKVCDLVFCYPENRVLGIVRFRILEKRAVYRYEKYHQDRGRRNSGQLQYAAETVRA